MNIHGTVHRLRVPLYLSLSVVLSALLQFAIKGGF